APHAGAAPAAPAASPSPAPSPAVRALLAAMDAAKVGDARPDVSALGEADREALGVAVVARVAHPRGRQAGVGPQTAYLQAAAALPHGADAALALLARPPPRRVVFDTSQVFNVAFEALEAHEADGSSKTPAACAQLTALLAHTPPALLRGATPAL